MRLRERDSFVRPQGFADAESFGLFMEAVRDLQIYEDEAAKAESDPLVLDRHLAQALDALERCHRLYPDDLFPRYYLGIALTMQNQRLYAQMLGARNSLLSDDPLVSRLGPLPAQPWPMLERALDCFDREDTYRSVLELRDAALFNCANVHVRLDTKADLETALEILEKLSLDHRGAPDPGALGWLATLIGPGARQRLQDEADAFNLSIRILQSLAKAMFAMRQDPLTAQRVVQQTLTDLDGCRNEARTELRDPMAKHDVLADALTKQGIIKYFAALTGVTPDDALLDAAAASLKGALEYKSNWIPAQTYLTQVYQARGRKALAAEQIALLLGKAPETRDAETATSTR